MEKRKKRNIFNFDWTLMFYVVNYSFLYKFVGKVPFKQEKIVVA
jgi:hypothetical protein